MAERRQPYCVSSGGYGSNVYTIESTANWLFVLFVGGGEEERREERRRKKY